MSCMDVFLSFVVKVHSVSHVTTTVCVKPYALFDLLRCERPAVRRFLTPFKSGPPPRRLGRLGCAGRAEACAQRDASRAGCVWLKVSSLPQGQPSGRGRLPNGLGMAGRFPPRDRDDAGPCVHRLRSEPGLPHALKAGDHIRRWALLPASTAGMAHAERRRRQAIPAAPGGSATDCERDCATTGLALAVDAAGG